MALEIINQYLSRNGTKTRSMKNVVLLTMHIQDGLGNPFGWFQSQSSDSHIWNPRATNASLVRYLDDNQVPWTNGDVVQPDMNNPVIAGLVNSGVDNTNLYALTIEHEGVGGQGITEAQLERSAQICAYWCKTWGIAPDRNHIIGHYQVGNHKYCPGANFPFDRLVARVKELVSGDKPVTGEEQAREFKETGFWVVNTLPDGTPIGFLKFWNERGALDIFGYPTSPAYIDNQTGFITQKFQRNYFEYHPENPEPYKVQLRLLGNENQALQLRVEGLEYNLSNLRKELEALKIQLDK